MAAIDWNEVAELRAKGETTASIAAYYGMTPNAFRARQSEYRRQSTKKSRLEGLIALAKATQKLSDEYDPIITKNHVGVFEKSIAIAFVSCLHLGSRYTDYDKLNDLIRLSEREDLYFVFLGDDVDGYEGFSDIASASEQAIASPLLQRNFLSALLDNITSEKVLAAFAGQHGAQWQRRNTGVDPLKQIYLERGIPYFDGQGFLELTVGSFQYKVFGGHKLKGRKNNYPLAAQLRAANTIARTADMVVMGDSHQYAVMYYEPEDFEGLSAKWLVQIGTFKTGNDPYTIRFWANGQFGYPIFVFKSNTEKKISYVSEPSLLKFLLGK